MDFQVEPCCNYLCKLKDISRRLASCAGAYNFISPKEGISTTQRCNLRWWIFQESFRIGPTSRRTCAASLIGEKQIAPCEESREIWHDTGEENKQGKWGIKKESMVRQDGLPFSRLWWFTRFYKGPGILAIKWSSYPDCLHKSGQGSWHFTLGEN